MNKSKLIRPEQYQYLKRQAHLYTGNMILNWVAEGDFTGDFPDDLERELVKAEARNIAAQLIAEAEKTPKRSCPVCFVERATRAGKMVFHHGRDANGRPTGGKCPGTGRSPDDRTS